MTDVTHSPHEVRGHAADSIETGFSYAQRLGLRLRVLRTSRALSLHDVEDASHQEFKASVLGAYERGERVISIARLERLARFYETPIDELLPDGRPRPVASSRDRRGQTAGELLTIDLRPLQHRTDLEGARVHAYLVGIQVQRRHTSGNILTIRRDDLRALAAILGTTPDEARRRLQLWSLLART
jgi:transcriptional regulator with XRE-family HTH domain